MAVTEPNLREEHKKTGRPEGKPGPQWHAAAALAASFLLLTFLLAEPDSSFFYLGILPDSILGLARFAWVRCFYAILIYFAIRHFRKVGLAAAVPLTALVLFPRSIAFYNNALQAVLSTAEILAIGILAALYRIKSDEHQAGQHHSKVWHENMQRKLYSRTRAGIERDKQLATLSDFSLRVALCANIDDVINIGLDIAQETMRVEAAAIFSLKEEPGELHLLAAKGMLHEDNFRHEPLKLGEGINGIVAQSGRCMAAYSGQNFNVANAFKGEDFKALGVVPLISRSKIIGTLTVATRKEHIFSMQELTVLETLGNQLGIALENTILSHEQVAIKEQLRESERQYREIFEKTNDIIWLEDLDGNIISANRACASMIGIELPELLGKNFMNFLPAGSVKKAADIRRQLLRGVAGEKAYDQKVLNSRGTEIILNVTTNLIDFGNIHGFQHIAKDITEERKMQENLQFYIQQITRAQEEERLRVSRELHDSTAQSLIVVLHQLEKYLVSSKHLLLSDSRFLWNVVEQVKAILQEVRHFSRDLRPSILDDLGLIPSLEWFIDELNRSHGIRINYIVRGTELRLLPEVEVTLFRIVQEALRNVIRHADAHHATVLMEFKEQEVAITVQDDGRGFNSKPLGHLLRAGKLGLAGMQERAKLLGGSIEIESLEGVGTSLFINIPTGVFPDA